jgi:hypothetical protein
VCCNTDNSEESGKSICTRSQLSDRWREFRLSASTSHCFLYSTSIELPVLVHLWGPAYTDSDLILPSFQIVANINFPQAF